LNADRPDSGGGRRTKDEKSMFEIIIDRVYCFECLKKEWSLT
jgi:hypothetical protein